MSGGLMQLVTFGQMDYYLTAYDYSAYNDIKQTMSCGKDIDDLFKFYFYKNLNYNIKYKIFKYYLYKILFKKNDSYPPNPNYDFSRKIELYLNFNQISQFMSSLLKNLKIDFIFI